MVYNFDHRIEDHLPTGNQSLVFYERWANAETMAGVFLAKVEPKASRFLEKWSALAPRVRGREVRRGDNAVLMLVVLEEVAKELGLSNKQLDGCRTKLMESQMLEWASMGDWIPYRDKFTACYRHGLGRRRQFQTVLIRRRGHGIANDEETQSDGRSKVPFSERSFILHGHYAGKNFKFFDKVFRNCTQDEEQCIEPLKCEIDGSVKGNSVKPVTDALVAFSEWNDCSRLGVGHHDVQHCLVNGTCTEDLTAEEWSSLGPILAENSECPDPAWVCKCGDGAEKVKNYTDGLSKSERAKFQRKKQMQNLMLDNMRKRQHLMTGVQNAPQRGRPR